ncbi:hypothetical protein BDP55DRAFT_376245 [Colletotrichum godetiae]|uniref:Uncharacterized protein n=1 Tax=Colletotrichum godetiae TaxID=1209918 RepID=A0AAJ0ASS4_9PEZI|nr:uncharacterized protein BDP55DRAFT_376245 [Colletotrichum godetiae]KAK1689706.1 hypothetical protein BDP55DRAFT_376245 [Colletotrichum godetiae]
MKRKTQSDPILGFLEARKPPSPSPSSIVNFWRGSPPSRRGHRHTGPGGVRKDLERVLFESLLLGLGFFRLRWGEFLPHLCDLRTSAIFFNSRRYHFTQPRTRAGTRQAYHFSSRCHGQPVALFLQPNDPTGKEVWAGLAGAHWDRIFFHSGMASQKTTFLFPPPILRAKIIHRL